MQAIKAIFDGVEFKPTQQIPVSGQYEVVITFVEKIPATPAGKTQDQINADLKFWKEIARLAADSNDEMLSLDDFPCMDFGREMVTFDDEV